MAGEGCLGAVPDPGAGHSSLGRRTVGENYCREIDSDCGLVKELRDEIAELRAEKTRLNDLISDEELPQGQMFQSDYRTAFGPLPPSCGGEDIGHGYPSKEQP